VFDAVNGSYLVKPHLKKANNTNLITTRGTNEAAGSRQQAAGATVIAAVESL
jgi:hypothetical protein